MWQRHSRAGHALRQFLSVFDTMIFRQIAKAELKLHICSRAGRCRSLCENDGSECDASVQSTADVGGFISYSRVFQALQGGLAQAIDPGRGGIAGVRSPP